MVIKKFYSKEYWEGKIQEWRLSDKSAQIWCQENQVVYTTFLGWRSRFERQEHTQNGKPSVRKSSAHASNQNHFIELKDKPKASTGIILECQGVQIHLLAEFDPVVLKKCLDTLRGAVC